MSCSNRDTSLRDLSIMTLYLAVFVCKKPRWILFFSSHKIKPSTTDNTFQLVKKRNCRNWFLSILCGKRKNGGFYQQVFMHFILYSKIDFFLTCDSIPKKKMLKQFLYSEKYVYASDVGIYFYNFIYLIWSMKTNLI